MGSGFGIDFLRIDGDGTGFNAGIDGGGTDEINVGFDSLCLLRVLKLPDVLHLTLICDLLGPSPRAISGKNR